jgi:hypothetical protein
MDQMKEDQTEKASRSELLVHPVGTPCRDLACSFCFDGRQRQACLMLPRVTTPQSNKQLRTHCVKLCCQRLRGFVARPSVLIGRAHSSLATFVDRRPGSDSPRQHAFAMPAGSHAVSQRLGKRWFYFCAHLQGVLTTVLVLAGVLCVATESYTGFSACFPQIGLARHSSHVSFEARARLKRTSLQHEAQNISACRTLGPTPHHLWNLRQFVNPKRFVRTGSYRNEC